MGTKAEAIHPNSVLMRKSYQISLIRSLFDQVSIARHRDLALQMGLIGYNTKLT